jgi:hypothetical protein
MTGRHCLIGLLGLVLLAGCRSTPTQTRIDLSTFDANGCPERHYTKFREAFYRMSPGGLVELVLQVERPSTIDPTQTISQVIYVKSFWNPQPARSYIEASQIDARVQYAMLTPPTGVRYDGSAMVTWRYDKNACKLAGWIESGTLAPRFRMGNAFEPFGPAGITGTFVAKENPGLVVNAAQALETQFSKPIPPAAG